MKTFFWMVHLTFTILLSYEVIFGTLNRIHNKIKQDNYDIILSIIACLLWSIWYFYYISNN